MSPEVIGIIIFIVAVIVGPFAAVKAVASFRARRGGGKSAAAPTRRTDKSDDDSSSW